MVVVDSKWLGLVDYELGRLLDYGHGAPDVGRPGKAHAEGNHEIADQPKTPWPRRLA